MRRFSERAQLHWSATRSLRARVVKIATFVLAALALGASGAVAQGSIAEQESATASLEALTGWWRYDHTEWGCDDRDGQYRAALGRDDFADEWQLIPGQGPLRFGFYEGRCELLDPVLRDGKLEMVALCIAEGEPYSGRATIAAQDDTSIVIASPAMNTTLIACDPGQAAGIAALASAASIESNTKLPVDRSMLDSYNGWWAFGGTPEACGIDGGPDKVAIGRFEGDTDQTVRFGTGDLHLRYQGRTCDLHEPQFIEGKIEALAICRFGGEEMVGRAVFLDGRDGDLQIRAPILAAELTRCAPTKKSLPHNPDTRFPAVPTETNIMLEPAFQVPENTETAAEPADKFRSTSPKQPPEVILPLKPMSVRKAVFAVYADYCDPSFGDGVPTAFEDVDARLYDRYRNQLLVRHLSQCSEFQATEVLPILAEDALAKDWAHIFAEGPSSLSEIDVVSTGMFLFAETLNPPCIGVGMGGDITDDTRELMRPLIAQIKAENFQKVALGYSAGMQPHLFNRLGNCGMIAFLGQHFVTSALIYQQNQK